MALRLFSYEQILEERKSIPLPILRYIHRLSQKMQSKLLPDSTIIHNFTEIEQARIETVKSFQFLMLHELLYSSKLIILLYGFDGEILDPLYSFYENILIYRTELNLPFDYYNDS